MINIFILKDTLTKDFVSVQSAEYGTRAYINSVSGRTKLACECPDDIAQKVFAVWGDTLTVDEPVLEQTDPVVTAPSTQDVINANIMARLAELEGVANG